MKLQVTEANSFVHSVKAPFSNMILMTYSERKITIVITERISIFNNRFILCSTTKFHHIN